MEDCHQIIAERAGFEPASPCGEHALQACALGQTTQPLRKARRLNPAGERDYNITTIGDTRESSGKGMLFFVYIEGTFPITLEASFLKDKAKVGMDPGEPPGPIIPIYSSQLAEISQALNHLRYGAGNQLNDS